MTVVNNFLLSREVVAGPASYATATPPTIVMSDLKDVEAVVSLEIDSGHNLQVTDITGQIVTFRIRGLDAAGMSDGDPMLEIPDAQDMSGFNITALAYGT